ncbi:uncharacterized protein BP01DRAFT_330779 [Aspergillus saccharolyticus JOP 1030-1]|uniref:Uncharacterized protein n=1 Tax=Aspergillus saccharolyticus JOP 1030-1 TaxID=1450539 RepID=A0A318ZPX7_9EURO|nr:hypothetical protein BP01DRAFT_330779 [Aspergillus saccharolyticus JOP 1030-1]PYH49576.1 hypothetical protein BP01DRAFT_330779 [Aspergillus saccharolyticus JOP 1030-1]
MPNKRVKRNNRTSQKLPSPPRSEQDAGVADDAHGVEQPASDGGRTKEYQTQDHESVKSDIADEDEMPEETISVGDQQAMHGAEYAGGRGAGYNALKSFNGQVYSGMAVGGSHTWKYDEGTWKETKEEPDLWRIDYQTNKRRAKKAPEGSGAPVGTEYHWLIVGHQQHVKKIDANTYETHLTGSKYKLAYKSASSGSWSVPTVRKQREREVELLEDAIHRVQGLPPVLASEKVKVEKHEKGQTKLDNMFGKVGTKRKAS